MKNIKGIAKKELDKVFKFPRSFISTLLLPGIIIFVMYFIIGQIADSSIKKSIDHQSNIIAINLPESFTSAIELSKSMEVVNNINFTAGALDNLDELKLQVQNGEIDAILVFEDQFDKMVDLDEKPEAIVYFNEMDMNSSTANSKIQMILENQKNNFLQEKEIDPLVFLVKMEPVTPEEQAGASILAMILPIFILSFIFGSAMGIGSDAVAGEKERGTLATLLVLPIPRNHIIIGKIISTTILTILAALSSFLGVIASLPFMKTVFMLEGGYSYGAGDYLALLTLLIILATLASCLLLVTSTFAKSVKEASAYALPIFMAVMILPMMNMFASSASVSKVMYLIPIYNYTIIFKDLLSFNFDWINLILVISSSLIMIAILVFALIKMFKNERILFSK